MFQKLFGLGKPAPVAPGTPVNGMPALPSNAVGSQAAAAPTQPGTEPAPDQQQKKKRGFFSRLFGGKGDSDKQPAQQDSSPPH